jgi:hypothetical protein
MRSNGDPGTHWFQVLCARMASNLLITRNGLTLTAFLPGFPGPTDRQGESAI